MNVLFVMLVIFIILLIVISQTMRMKELERENSFLESYMNSLQGFYGALQNKIEITRKYRHDIARHIQTLETLLEGETKSLEIEEQVKELKDVYRSLSTDRYCEDEIINAILLMKIQKCNERKILIDVDAPVRCSDKIQEVDMVGLLHNLLDNAIEACEQIEEEAERKIIFSMNDAEGKLCILVKNTIVEGKDITFETTKGSKEEHGIGLKIVKDFVQKYDGNITTQIEDKWISIQVMI